jgi:hypothetical protein
MAKSIFGVMEKLENDLLYFYLVDSKGTPMMYYSVPLTQKEWPTVHSALHSLVVEIEVSSASRGRLTKPKFLRFRTDKNVLECSIEQVK